MIGALQPASRKRFLISGTAAAASGTLTVQRTISEPASASSTVCLNVVATSAVSVFVIDCTTMGALPPTSTCPTRTPYVLRRGRPLATVSVPLIWVSIPYNSSVNSLFGEMSPAFSGVAIAQHVVNSRSKAIAGHGPRDGFQQCISGGRGMLRFGLMQAGNAPAATLRRGL